MKKFLNEFKEFASRGNVLDIAVGLIVGTAFTSVVSSLINDIILPIITAITFKTNISSLRFVIPRIGSESIVISYGLFLQAVIDFLIVAFCAFVMIKMFNKIMRNRDLNKGDKDAIVSDETKALREIVDLLKNKRSF